MDSYTASPLVNITFCASCLIYRHVLPLGNVHCLSWRSTQTAEREHLLQRRFHLSSLPALIQLFHHPPTSPLGQNHTALGSSWLNTHKWPKMSQLWLSIMVDHMKTHLSLVNWPQWGFLNIWKLDWVLYFYPYITAALSTVVSQLFFALFYKGLAPVYFSLIHL